MPRRKPRITFYERPKGKKKEVPLWPRKRSGEFLLSEPLEKPRKVLPGNMWEEESQVFGQVPKTQALLAEHLTSPKVMSIMPVFLEGSRERYLHHLRLAPEGKAPQSSGFVLGKEVKVRRGPERGKTYVRAYPIKKGGHNAQKVNTRPFVLIEGPRSSLRSDIENHEPITGKRSRNKFIAPLRKLVARIKGSS